MREKGMLEDLYKDGLSKEHFNGDGTFHWALSLVEGDVDDLYCVVADDCFAYEFISSPEFRASRKIYRTTQTPGMMRSI
jgi:hypothetical protein